MNYNAKIKKLSSRIESLNKRSHELSLEANKQRVKLDKEKKQKIRKKYREIREKINKLNYEIGELYEKQAISIKSNEERLSLLLKTLEYFEKSSYSESLRVLKLAKSISISTSNNKIERLCDAKILYIECEILDDDAEVLWYNCLRLGGRGEIDERDDKWTQLSLLRDTIVEKLNKGLQYAQESDNLDTQLQFLTRLSWHLYRRLDRNKFRKEISIYHKRAAQIYESIAMKNIITNPSLSIKNLRHAAFQYSFGDFPDDKKRIYKTIYDVFKNNLSKKELFSIKWNTSDSSEDFKNLADEIERKEKDGLGILLHARARQFELKAKENSKDLESYFKASEYYENLHKKRYKNLKTGPNIGNSYFFKGLGYARLAISAGLISNTGKEHLKIAIENIQKSIDVSDWAFREPIYLSIYKTIYELINLPSEKINKTEIKKGLKIAKFLSWQYNISSEKIVSENLDLLVNAVFEKDNVSAIEYLKNIEVEISEIKSETKELIQQIIPTVGWEKAKSIEPTENFRKPLDKTELKGIWEKCKTEKNKQKKGKLLEEFIVKLFVTIENFVLFKKNLNTANEELDIVFRNNIERPFWISLNSSHIFFECKNWSGKIQARIVRELETKLTNHSNLTRIGIFVAIMGYESGCFVEQMRCGRGNNIIVLISGEDIDNFLKSSQDTIEWMDKFISSCIR